MVGRILILEEGRSIQDTSRRDRSLATIDECSPLPGELRKYIAENDRRVE